jgi:hypothetical protein
MKITRSEAMSIACALSESPAEKKQLIFDFLAFARHEGKKIGKTFDTSSLILWHHLLNKEGFLSPDCVQTLDNIVAKFRMRYFQRKPYYPDWKGKGKVPPYVDPGCLIVGGNDDN